MTAQKRKALIDSIVQSEWFVGAKFRILLLRYLAAHENRAVSAKELVHNVFTHLLPKSQQIDDDMLAVVRRQCYELRVSLASFNASTSAEGQPLRCELPEAIPGEGYRLRFIIQGKAARPTLCFWRPHLNPERHITIVVNEPLFYRNTKTNAVFRFADMTEDDAESEEAIRILQTQHEQLYAQEVYASRTYMLSGEIEAHDYINEWFETAAARKTSRRISRSTVQAEINDSSPILLGNTRTNRFMRKIVKDEGTSQNFRVSPDRFGIVEVHHATTREEDLLRNEFASNIRPGSGTIVLEDDPRGDVFAVVTRIPNPSGEGAVTIICSDYSQCLGQVARTLTDDGRLAELFGELQWLQDKVVPRAFQWLFAVHLWETEARKPVLVAANTKPQGGSVKLSPAG
jgi:hypothetical protein